MWLGVDGCKHGWVGVASTSLAEPPRLLVHAGLEGLVDEAMVDEATALPAMVICIDIPVGLSRTPRAYDAWARSMLPRCASRVFSPPCEEVLACETYAHANTLSRELTGKGLSKQAWNIMPRMRDAQQAAAQRGLRLHETHPEVCFAQLQGGPVVASKKTHEGFAARCALLRVHAPVWWPSIASWLTPGALAGYRKAPVRTPATAPTPQRDDIVDAAVLCLCAGTALLAEHQSAHRGVR